MNDVDLTDSDRELIERIHAEQLTMCPPQRCRAFARACRKVTRDGIRGDVVICGVWRGGLAILAASILRGSGRALYLYDTFAGMTEPGPKDGEFAAALYAKHQRGAGSDWCLATLEEVRSNLIRYRGDHWQWVNVAIIKGDIIETMQQAPPISVAVAYLDTDFYASTAAELRALHPAMPSGGVMFFDDYGTWPGCRAAVDEYLGAGAPLHIIDNASRYLVKP